MQPMPALETRFSVFGRVVNGLEELAHALKENDVDELVVDKTGLDSQVELHYTDYVL